MQRTPRIVDENVELGEEILAEEAANRKTGFLDRKGALRE